MIHTKYLILGAGPSGLTFANRLLMNGENDFIVLERDSEAGGLCKSVTVDGKPLDIGGGHFLDVKNPTVTNFVFHFLPEEEWDIYSRDSRIDMGDFVIGSPIEANIWQMPEDVQKEYLEAIADAGCNKGTEKPEKFVDWIYWKLGSKIASDYMIPYNQKMFGDNLNELGTYWLEKLPNVSYEETLLSCQNKKPYGTQPGHAKFYYPKEYGYGEVWLRMADALGDRIKYNTPAISLDADSNTVNGEYSADYIICTVPWNSINEITGISETSKDNIDKLKYTSISIEYFANNLDTDAQWIYYPDSSLSYHRILVRHNFCPDSKGYWTETNLTRFDEAKSKDGEYFISDYAYPLNTIGKPELMEQLLNEMKEKNIYGLGRWGEWQHFNSDVVVARAIDLADSFTK